jgi:hypothetical protein
MLHRVLLLLALADVDAFFQLKLDYVRPFNWDPIVPTVAQMREAHVERESCRCKFKGR